MLETALRRQVWIMLLDDQFCPLPILVPIDVEAEPYGDDASFFADIDHECLGRTRVYLRDFLDLW